MKPRDPKKTQKDSECKWNQWNQETQQGFAVRGKNRNLFIICVGCCDGRESCQWRHDHLRKRWRCRFRQKIRDESGGNIHVEHFHIKTPPNVKLDIESRLNKQGTGSLVLRRASSCNHIMKPPQELVADQSQVEHMCVIWQHVCVSSLEVPKPIKASTGFLLKLSISRSFGSLILKHRMLRLAQSPVITWKNAAGLKTSLRRSKLRILAELRKHL